MKFFCKKIFAVRKILEPKKTRVLKNFGSNKIGRKIFWVKKNFGKKIFGQQFFLSKHIFESKKSLVTKYFFVPKKFLGQKNFG